MCNQIDISIYKITEYLKYCGQILIAVKKCPAENARHKSRIGMIVKNKTIS